MREGEKGFDEARFEKVKASQLGKLEDAISQGKVDRQMVKFCRFLGSAKNYATTSSCAGRIMLLAIPKEGNKKESYFHERWHREVGFGELSKAIAGESRGELWLKQEPFILHIACSGLDASRKMLAIMKKAGVKRGGIIVAKQGKFIIELQGTQNIALPVKKGEKILVDGKFLKYLWKRANEKFRRNHLMLKKFEKTCRAELK